MAGRLHTRPRRQQTRSTARKLSSIVALFASIDPAAGAEIVTLPLLLAGLGDRRAGLSAGRRDGVVEHH
jgi:hypothetical protein